MTTIVKLSKLMAFVLRHNPSSVGISLTSEGWVPLSTLASALTVSVEEIMEVVTTDSKQRFTVSEEAIRAAQGHSIVLDIEFTAATPPEFLWHGTVISSMQSILKEGLLPMSRQFVHLSSSAEVAATVARRRSGEVVLLKVETKQFLQAGHRLVQSENGIWLTKHIPALFITTP